MALNRVMLIGNLGADPDVRYTQAGEAIATLSLATSEKWKDKQTGEAKEKTEWHRVVFFGRQAEALQQYTHKGSKLYVEGQLTTRKWQDKDGADRYTTEIRGRVMEFLDSRGAGQGGDQAQRTSAPTSHASGSQPTPAHQPADPGDDFFDDDIPF